MTTQAPASEKAKELSEAQIEQLQGVYSGALKGAVAECGVESVPDLLLDMAKRMEQEARRLKAGPPVDARASHTQLMIALGKKEETKTACNIGEKDWIPEGVPEVAFYPAEGKAPTFFYDTAAAVKNPTLPEGRQSWGYTTDFAPFEKIIWPLFKEIVR